ncbi:P-loop NTPase family protein [Kitasatospora mediocidica]|uniref:hypothetical protein n=1 Tax=Kitasatospora mediocidica TaxID=58352 RepID=UPI00056355B0|nr:hypothetical protein [Kitasatospora mediocidica]
MKQNAWRAVVAAAVVVGVAGCGSGRPAGPDTGGAPAIGPIPVVLTVSAINRPIDAYLPSVASVKALITAVDAVTARCMKQYGLPFDPAAPIGLDDLNQQDKMRSPLYGFFDPDAARANGYEVSAGMPAAATPGQGQAELSPAAIAVLGGRDASGNPATSYAGRPVPAGGCQQQGVDAVGGYPPRPDAQALPDHGPVVPTADPRMRAVDTAWSACMKSRGFDYANPAAALADPQWAPKGAGNQPPTAKEVATVTADLDCKRSTNLMGVAVAVETAYDQQYIASHRTQLAAYTQQLQARVGQAAHLVG